MCKRMPARVKDAARAAQLASTIFSPNSEQATPTSSVYGHGHALLLMEINRSDAAVVYNYYFEPIPRR